jgi:hypothetical protein
VPGDGEQPGRKGSLVIVAQDVLISAQKSFLGSIFRLARIAQHPVAQVIDWRLVKIYQTGKRFGIAVLRHGNAKRFDVFHCIAPRLFARLL